MQDSSSVHVVSRQHAYHVREKLAANDACRRSMVAHRIYSYWDFSECFIYLNVSYIFKIVYDQVWILELNFVLTIINN